MNVDISADTRCVTDGCSAPGMWPASNSAGERTSMVSTRGLHLKASKFPIFGRFRRFLCFLDLIGILLCVLYEKQTVSFDVNSLPFGHLHLNSARSARPSERRDSNDAKGNDTGEGPRGLVELDHPRLPRRSQRYNAELRQIMTFSDASKAFKTLPLNAPLWPCGPQCSKIWLLSGVKLRKSPKDASSYDLRKQSPSEGDGSAGNSAISRWRHHLISFNETVNT